MPILPEARWHRPCPVLIAFCHSLWNKHTMASPSFIAVCPLEVLRDAIVVPSVAIAPSAQFCLSLEQRHDGIVPQRPLHREAAASGSRCIAIQSRPIVPSLFLGTMASCLKKPHRALNSLHPGEARWHRAPFITHRGPKG